MFSAHEDPSASFHLPPIVQKSVVSASQPTLLSVKRLPASSSQQAISCFPQGYTSTITSLPPVHSRQPFLRRSLSRIGPLQLGLGFNLGGNVGSSFGASGKREASEAVEHRQPVHAVAGATGDASEAPERNITAGGVIDVGNGLALPIITNLTTNVSETPAADHIAEKRTRRRSGWEWLKGTQSLDQTLEEEDGRMSFSEEVAAALQSAEVTATADAGNTAPQDLAVSAEYDATSLFAALHVPSEPATEIPKDRPLSRRSITFNLKPQPGSDVDDSGDRGPTPAGVRKRRSGWWDGTSDRETEIRRVKEMVRQTGPNEEPPQLVQKNTDDPPDEGRSTVSAERPESENPTKQTESNESARALRLRKRNSSVAMQSILQMTEAPDESVDPYRRASLPAGISVDESADKMENLTDIVELNIGQTASSSPRLKRRSSIKRKANASLTSTPPIDSPDSPKDESLSAACSSTSFCDPSTNEPNSGQKVVESLPRLDVDTPNTEHTAIAAAAELARENSAAIESPDPESLAELLERTKVMSARLKQLQTQLQQVQLTSAKQRDLLVSITDIERRAALPPVPQHLAIHVMARYCDSYGMESATRTLIRDPGPTGKTARRTVLWDRLMNKRFAEAVQVVEDVMAVESKSPVNTSSQNHISHFTAAFEDLLYVLTKYLYIDLVQRKDIPNSQKVLDGILKPKVVRERAGKSRGRGEWFTKDLTLLADLITRNDDANGDINEKMSNPYARLNWTKEYEGFWGAARTWRQCYKAALAESASSQTVDVEHGGPLFARALGEFFCDESFDEGADSPVDTTLDSLYRESQNWNSVRGLLKNVGTHHTSPLSPTPRKGRSRRGPASRSQKNRKQSVDTLQNGSADHSTRKARKQGSVTSSLNTELGRIQTSATTPSPVESKLKQPEFDLSPACPPPPIVPKEVAKPRPSTRPQNSSSDNTAKKTRRQSSEVGDINRRGSRSGRSDEHSAQTPFSFNGEADLPPPPTELLSSDFALASTCGPVLNEIRALDVTCIPETGQIIAATAGSHDRSDKRISLWDVRSGTLLTQLDNGTSKPVTCLAFHPDDPYQLLSADMEFDVKLWNWQEGAVIRLWKKFHTRIVFRAAVVPGGGNQAATCSGDQSVKVFPLDTAAGTTVASMHANEPFTSFVFVGNPDDSNHQKLVASLSYSIRIYRLRTATLLHTISMTDLRANKTPITALSSHPVHDSYILISCDNQLRLLNLITETTVKIYQSRDIPNGVRVEGQFSPCGGWVYCGTWDVRGRVKKESAERLPNKGGVVIWKVHTGKSEMLDCRADVGVCRWIVARENRRADVVSRKVMVAGGLDRMIRMYM
ncbi:hypothetical protein PhCBS80983_g05170 [Powellomyces hirtus]|uniref:Uncharacterized protein n=1 Tax=Powellomyces hirtus TaxID=109895 RepID=A0A507DWF1_9FUNG|nr:hypothetical protein PhCBS80983_g05170 [Powellomyces hirtus]